MFSRDYERDEEGPNEDLSELMGAVMQGLMLHPKLSLRPKEMAEKAAELADALLERFGKETEAWGDDATEDAWPILIGLIPGALIALECKSNRVDEGELVELVFEYLEPAWHAFVDLCEDEDDDDDESERRNESKRTGKKGKALPPKAEDRRESRPGSASRTDDRTSRDARDRDYTQRRGWRS